MGLCRKQRTSVDKHYPNYLRIWILKYDQSNKGWYVVCQWGLTRTYLHCLTCDVTILLYIWGNTSTQFWNPLSSWEIYETRRYFLKPYTPNPAYALLLNRMMQYWLSTHWLRPRFNKYTTFFMTMKCLQQASEIKEVLNTSVQRQIIGWLELKLTSKVGDLKDMWRSQTCQFAGGIQLLSTWWTNRKKGIKLHSGIVKKTWYLEWQCRGDTLTHPKSKSSIIYSLGIGIIGHWSVLVASLRFEVR